MLRSVLSLLVVCLALPLAAQPADPADGERLVAAASHVPPFAILNADGTWDGIAVELWREIGRREGFEAAVAEVEPDAVLDAVASGRADVGLTAPAPRLAIARARSM